MRYLAVDERKCTNCRICELVCSANNEGVYNPELSRITKVARGLPELTVSVVCRQCEDAPCMQSCPAEAICFDMAYDIIRINYDKCIGCELCAQECTYGAIKVDREKGRVFKCELCDGDPVCMQKCPAGAITIQEGQAGTKALDNIDEQLKEFGISSEIILIGNYSDKQIK